MLAEEVVHQDGLAVVVEGRQPWPVGQGDRSGSPRSSGTLWFDLILITFSEACFDFDNLFCTFLMSL